MNGYLYIIIALVCLLVGALAGLFVYVLPTIRFQDKLIDYLLKKYEENSKLINHYKEAWEGAKAWGDRLFKMYTELESERTMSLTDYDYKCKVSGTGKCQNQCCYICPAASECKKDWKCKGTPLMCGLSVKDGEVK